MQDDSKKKLQKRISKLKTLKPRKHKQLDFFIADVFDASNFRDDFISMEHPIFALKAGDTRVINYQHGDVNITIRPSVEIGRATIFDKDIWIYCISKLCQAMYENEPISRTIRFSSYDFLVTTNRDTGGNNYLQLEQSLNRLRGTSITTNIQTNNEFESKYESHGFGLIESWGVEATQKGSMLLDMIEVTLPDWLFNSIINTNVLSISQDYFRIRKAIDRRIYELARKHCGSKEKFNISLEKLHKKSGSKQDLRRFRSDIKVLAESNDLPDYEIIYNIEKDIICFFNKNKKMKEEINQAKINIDKKTDREVENGDLVRKVEKHIDEKGRVNVQIIYGTPDNE